LAANLKKEKADHCMTNDSKVLIYLSFLLFLRDLLFEVMQKERYQSQINQNFGTVCQEKSALHFLRLAAKLLEMITKF
jgi:hypothetical protein